ncbi:hypothetical protein E2C01_068336 [Portunus trituberculatus]|uniref:Uncharacterized protein n=1 Tax=Portunus trituberculatus TaxID=210409 RepID=A0A5B7HRP6_PORTR|nr:hypothetical protein [Portunus trituberculatus]
MSDTTSALELSYNIHQEHKEKLEEVLKELNEFKHRMNPTIEKSKKINAALSGVKKIVHSKTQLVRKSQLANENLKAQSNNVADKLKDAHRHFATQKAEEQERLAELKDYQRQLDVLQGQLQNLPGLDGGCFNDVFEV